MTERAQAGKNSGEVRKLDPFSHAINQFNAILVGDGYNAVSLEHALLTVQSTGLGSPLIAREPWKVLDRIALLTLQAATKAKLHNDEGTEGKFVTIADGFRAAVNLLKPRDSHHLPQGPTSLSSLASMKQPKR